MTDYQRGYKAGVAASAQFLRDAADQPTYADELVKYVLPSRNWRKRFQAAVIRDIMEMPRGE